MRSKTVPTEHVEIRIEIKTKGIIFNLFYFHFDYVVDLSDARVLAMDKQYGRNGDFLSILQADLYT